MTMTFPHWISEDYFHALVSSEESVNILALDKLVDDVQTNKRTTTIHLLSSGYGDAVISNLVSWLQSDSDRTSGNAAFVLGSMAEDSHACLKIINNPSSFPSNERLGLAKILISMLASQDDEAILNATGTLGTIAECDEGREWLLDQIERFDYFLERLDFLLLSRNRWIASNAALILARLTVSDRGLYAILGSCKSEAVLERLVSCLGNDGAGCGMNCAFALGRVCDAWQGVRRLKKLRNRENLLRSINEMLATVPTSTPEWGVCKNACYCFSCLVATQEGNQWVVTTPRLLTGDDYFFACDYKAAGQGDKQSPTKINSEVCILSSITRLLDMSNSEASWFAAMAIRSLISQPRGLVAVRRYPPVIAALKNCLESPNASRELFDEATVIMQLLGPLPQAPKPKVLIYGPNSALIRWSPLEAPGNLPVTYMLYFQSEDSDETELVYKGYNLETRVKDLQPYTKYFITLKGVTEVEEGPPSEVVQLVTEEAVPPAPTDFRAVTVTTNQVRVQWNPPKKMRGVLRYFMVRVECLDKPAHFRYTSPSGFRKQPHSVIRYRERTTDSSAIVSGLSPNTLYSFSVCAVNGRGVGPPAVLSVRTQGLGPHWPSKPSVTVLGRSEVMVHWEAPKVALGRITRYEVLVNKQKSASVAGALRRCRVSNLQPDTEYAFTVVLVTNFGKFESKPTKKRTAKDEYACSPRAPLHDQRNRRNKMSEMESLRGKSRSVCETRTMSAKAQNISPPKEARGRISEYCLLTSLSMPNLVAPSVTKEPGSRGDRANPVRTNSSPAIRSQRTDTVKSTQPTGPKAALIPCSCGRSSNILYKTRDTGIQYAVFEPTTVILPESRDPSVHSLKSNSGDRSTASECVLRSPRPPYSLIPTPKLEPTVNSDCSVTMEPVEVQAKERKLFNNQSLVKPRKRSSGFWHFRMEKVGEKRAQSAHVRSESAQSVGSSKQQNWRERLNTQIMLSKCRTDNFYTDKKSMMNLFCRNFWQKRRPSTADPVQITLVEEPSPTSRTHVDKQANRADPPSIRLIPPSISGTHDEISTSSSLTVHLNSAAPIIGIQAPVRYNIS